MGQTHQYYIHIHYTRFSQRVTQECLLCAICSTISCATEQCVWSSPSYKKLREGMVVVAVCLCVCLLPLYQPHTLLMCLKWDIMEFVVGFYTVWTLRLYLLTHQYHDISIWFGKCTHACKSAMYILVVHARVHGSIDDFGCMQATVLRVCMTVLHVSRNLLKV